MDKSIELAEEYAKTYSDHLQSLLAKAFEDGYNQGKFDSNHFINIDGVEYFDAELPSGTLWSWPLQYENYGWHLKLSVFNDVKDLNLPTKDQWVELCTYCQQKDLKLIAPNGLDLGYPTCHNSPTNLYTTYTLGEECKKGHNRFWLKSEPDEKNMVEVIEFDYEVNKFDKHFTGFKLPFFLVKNKSE